MRLPPLFDGASDCHILFKITPRSSPPHATVTITRLLKTPVLAACSWRGPTLSPVAPLGMQQLHVNHAIRTSSSAQVIDNGFGKISCINHLPVRATSNAVYVPAQLQTANYASEPVRAKGLVLIFAVPCYRMHTLGFIDTDIFLISHRAADRISVIKLSSGLLLIGCVCFLYVFSILFPESIGVYWVVGWFPLIDIPSARRCSPEVTDYAKCRYQE